MGHSQKRWRCGRVRVRVRVRVGVLIHVMRVPVVVMRRC